MTEGQIEFVPKRATPEEWRRYHDFRRRRHAEWRAEKPLTPDDIAQKSMLALDSRVIRNRWVAVRGDAIVSRLETSVTDPSSPEYQTNRHLLSADVFVLQQHRRQGIGRSWVPKLVETMERHQATVMTASAEDETGQAFLRRLGAEPKKTERESLLDVRDVDWEMVGRWVEAGQAASPQSRLEVYRHPLPEELLEEYCGRLSELLSQVPSEGLDRGDIFVTTRDLRETYALVDETGSSMYSCIIREPDGSITGITDVVKHPYEHGLVHQWFTGVDPSVRGRGRGKWLKATMLLHLRSVHPDTVTIQTGNAGSNAPMLTINHQLGFRLRRIETLYQVDRETLARRL